MAVRENRWFRIREAGTGTAADPYRPDFGTHRASLDSWSGTKTHPEGSPKWVCRVYADTATLDALAAESYVQSYSSAPADSLNTMFGRSLTATEWNQRFSCDVALSE